MMLRRLRSGELLALAGVVLIVVSLIEPWYEVPLGNLDAWDTFGGAVVLLIAAACAALALVLSAVFERSPALPVSIGVWCTLLGVIAVIAAIVRLLERPHHSGGLCSGPWIALAGAVTILAGAWQSLRDERGSLYEPARPEPRERP
jgi:drug/metabolite transporter (DMT)-like permease